MVARITHLIPVFKPGGAELQLATLAKAQARQGDAVSIWSLAADEPLRDEMRAAGVAVTALKNDGARRWITAGRDARSSDVVHSWMYHGFIMGAAIRPFSPAIHVWGIRRTEPFSPGLKRRTRTVVRLARFLAPRAAHALVFCARTTRDRHVEAGFRAPHLAVTLNAIPDKYLEPVPDPRNALFTAGCLTRWTFDKGIDVLLRAWVDFLATGHSGELHLAGPGIDDSNRELAAMVAEYGVADSVRLLGPFREPRDFHRSLDVYVSPSRTEGFPNVVAEAMATGRPVVATDVGGTAEVMGDTGRLVANEDHSAIAANLVELAESPELRASIGASARTRCAKEFTIALTEAAVRRAYADAGTDS